MFGLLAAPVAVATPAAVGAACGLAQAAFCDTFDAPSPNGAGTRSGDLDGLVWGVSRVTSDDNPGQGSNYSWLATHRTTCGTQTVGPERDLAICNGQLVESVTDGDNVTALAMYPRQPFDFAGRTGVATFDVNDDTQGPHGAWPAFVITDQPVPAPYQDAAGLADYARNSVGVSFANNCSGNQTGVDSIWTTTNYRLQLRSFNNLTCINKGTPTALNHFEVHISPTAVHVFGSDAGGVNFREIANASFAMPLTRGLAWIEDIHYNANKFGNQGTHTFVWDNFGFDGPVLARDLGFDVLDATHSGTSGGSLGYTVPAGGSLTLQIPNVHGVENAAAALLEFNWWVHDHDSVTYSVNGHPSHTQAWPYVNSPTFVSQTIALPVPLSEVVNGTNTVRLTSTDSQLGGVSVANIDLILAGAGGIPGGGTPVPTSTPVPATDTPTSTPTAQPTDTPTPTPTATATPVPTGTATPSPTSTTTPVPDVCQVQVLLNGVQKLVTKPLAFCTDQ